MNWKRNLKANRRGSRSFVSSLLVWLWIMISLAGCQVDDDISDWSGPWGTGADFGVGIAVDDSGDVFITGHTLGRLNDTENQGGVDLFLTKYDASDNMLWTRYLASEHNERGVDLAVDHSGNVFGVGYTYGDLGGSHQGEGDLLWFKYSSDGVPKWIRQLGGEFRDQGIAIALDASGDILIAGRSYGEIVPGITHYGSSDIFIMKCHPNGNPKWIISKGTPGFDQPSDIAADASGDIFVVGWTLGDLTGDGNDGAQSDVFIAKYDSTGDQIWIRQFGTSNDDFGLSLAVDSSGDVFITGYTYGDMDASGDNVHSGSSDVFIAKYDSTGDQIWLKQFGTSQKDEAKGIYVDQSGDVIVAGQTRGSLKEEAAWGGYDIFLIKMRDTSSDVTSDITADSGVEWIRQTGSSADDFCSAMATDSSGDMFITGHTYGNLDGSTNKGLSDIFLLGYDSSGDAL